MTVAIVTGGASGIGRAIAAALVERGARVVIADLNLQAAELAAKQLTETAGPAAGRLTEAGHGRADAARLDVTDGAAVLACYRAVAAEHGRLDLVFNNAGIAIGGVTEEFTLDHWDRVIDVNLRGVVHGVHAAYPIMLAQGGGHIVNTASLAGLVQPAIMIPYTVTKSAVVALSVALRAEGAARGVRVSALCPGFVDTPLLDNVNAGLPPTGVNDKTRRVIGRLQPRMYTADKLAVDVMRGVARNKPIIVAPASARFAALVARYTPAIAQAVNRQQVRRYLREGA
ncbi:MAG TPA: SDR family NAD(P)-dependent oxidoreductase [Pseudonocardiaceae bacterium]|nr:SDR family NAD(P)-dependent oxidoreductase [Pseudonocardiaceae bacterium]